MIRLLLLLPLLLSGCAGSGEGGAWTPEDTRAAIGAIDEGANAYRNVRSAYRGEPYPVYPVQPVPYP